MQIKSDILSSKIVPLNGMRKSIAFVDGDSVSNAIARVEHNTCGAACRIEGQNCLVCSEKGRDIERLEH